MDERRLRARIPRGLEKIQRTDRVDIEIVERPRSREVVARLRGRMNNCIRGNRTNRIRDSFPVAHIEFMVAKVRQLPFKTFPIPNGISLRSKKLAAHVVVHPMDFPSLI